MPADLDAPLQSASARHSLSPSSLGSLRQVPGLSRPASSHRAHGWRADLRGSALHAGLPRGKADRHPCSRPDHAGPLSPGTWGQHSDGRGLSEW